MDGISYPSLISSHPYPKNRTRVSILKERMNQMNQLIAVSTQPLRIVLIHFSLTADSFHLETNHSGWKLNNKLPGQGKI